MKWVVKIRFESLFWFWFMSMIWHAQVSQTHSPKKDKTQVLFGLVWFPRPLLLCMPSFLH